MLRLTLIFFIFVVSATLTQSPAQEKKSDPYDEYSHLWEENTKKNKKSKKKSSKKTVSPATTPADTIPKKEPVVPKDSTQNKQPSTPKTTADTTSRPSMEPMSQDTLPKPQNPVPTDTIPQTEPVKPTPEPQTEPVVKDTIPSQEELPVVSDSTSMDEPEEPVAEKAKKEKKKLTDFEPVASDFRGAMGGGSSGGGNINGGVTFTQIDNQYYAGLTLQPEFSIWKIGVGMNVPILFNIEDQTFRSEIFEGGVGLARLITYLRFGRQKQDQIYVRVGELNGIMVGFGGLVNNYTNSTTFEKRKVGMHYDVNYKGLIGLEGMYSDFDPTSRNLLVTRPYVRPLGFLSIPIVRTLEIGTTFVQDRDQTNIPILESDSSTNYAFTSGDGVGAFGFDAGVNLLSVPFVQIDAFFNYGRLNLESQRLTDSIAVRSVIDPSNDGYSQGSGSSYGVNFRFNFIADLLKTDVRIERLSYTEHYLPQFFDFSYELNKDGRIFATTTAESKSGIYGSLTGHILQTIQLGGSLLIPDEISEATPAVVQVNASAERVADKFSLQANYLKGNLSNLEDAFTFDERSVAKVRLIYHVNKFLAAGMDYYYAWVPDGQGDFAVNRFVSPYFGLSIKL